MSDPANGGTPVTRYELSLTVKRIDENIQGIRDDVTALREQMRVAPRWVGARMTGLIDKGISAGFIGVVVYLASKLAGH